MKDMAQDFWLSSDASKVFEIANAEQKTLQPIIAKVIEEFQPKSFLDYGCGDSFISGLIDKNIKIGLYDINLEESKKAYSKLQDRNCNLYNTTEEIPINHFDCINFSLVLICLANKIEFTEILSRFKKYKTKNGKIIITTTHPCFRQYEYRPFYTNYSIGKEFNYFNKLEPFEVFIRDNEHRPVQFTDYHWTLSDTINEISKAGLFLEKLIEVPDMTFDNIPENKHFSPFIIFICK